MRRLLLIGGLVAWSAVPATAHRALHLAILLSATAYRRLPSRGGQTSRKGIAISVVAGLLMGYFYRFVAASMSVDLVESGSATLRGTEAKAAS